MSGQVSLGNLGLTFGSSVIEPNPNDALNTCRDSKSIFSYKMNIDTTHLYYSRLPSLS